MSTLKVDTLVAADGSSAVELTKAQTIKFWVYYEPDNSNNVRGSFNHSSLTDIGTAARRLHYTNNMSDTDYCVLTTQQENRTNGVAFGYEATSAKTGSVRTWASPTGHYNGEDSQGEYVSNVGDLA